MTFKGGAFVLGVLLVTTNAAAADCPVNYGFRPSQLARCDKVGAIPPNGILRERKSGSIKNAAHLAPASWINERFPCSGTASVDCVPVMTVQGAQLGTRLVSTMFTGCILDLTVHGEPDKLAPPAPVIGDVTVNLVKDPGACEIDGLAIRVDNVIDDQFPSLLQLALYVGATEDEARTSTRIDHLLEVFDGNTSVTLSANLGLAEGRERPIARGLLAAGRRCFAVETVDWAGNFSPRSAPVCLDHTDERDPHVRVVAGADTDGCATSPRAPRLGWLLALGLVVAYRLRRKRR